MSLSRLSVYLSVASVFFPKGELLCAGFRRQVIKMGRAFHTLWWMKVLTVGVFFASELVFS